MQGDGAEGALGSGLPDWAPELVDATDPSLGLRGHRAGDVAEIVEQCRDEDTRRWTNVPDPYDTRDAQTFVRSRPDAWSSGRELSLAVEVEGRFAGSVRLRPSPGGAAGSAELGFGIAPWARGRRRGAQAVRLLLSWAFEVLPLQYVTCRPAVGNWAGRRVAWDVGITWHGVVPALSTPSTPFGALRTAWLGSVRRGTALRPDQPWLSVPELVGRAGRERRQPVLLRPHHDADADRIVQACSDARTQHWLPQLPSPYTSGHARAFLEECREDLAEGRAVHWAVAPDRQRPLLAEVGVYLRSALEAEIGYWSHPQGRGRGLITAAVRLAARHALIPVEDGGLGRQRVLIRAAEGNTASRRVALAAGFRQAGVDRAAERLRDGRAMDMVRYDLLAGEHP